jgi:hypothetical protein
VQPPGDHQVQDEEALVREREHDPLAHAGHRQHAAPDRVRQGWVRGAQQIRATDRHGVKHRPDDPAFQVFDVDRHVRPFGHA